MTHRLSLPNVSVWALALAACATAASAQQPAQAPRAGGAPAQQDLSAVMITTTKISDRVYALDGQGGRMGVHVGPDGIFIVDSQFAPLTDTPGGRDRKVSPSANPVSRQHPRPRRSHRRQRELRQGAESH